MRVSTAELSHTSELEAETRRPFKADHVYAVLKEEILSGTLAPGTAIDKSSTCERLGVSRFPVGAAINRLAFDKLVVIEPQHGSFVSCISLQEVRELMLIRRAVEGDLAAEAARLGSDRLVADLERNLAGQAAAAESGDHAGFYALDLLFHAALIEALALFHVREVLERVLTHLERVRRLLTQPPGRVWQTLADHRAIAHAIAASDPETARAAARDHLARTTALFEAFARDNPTLFAESDHA